MIEQTGIRAVIHY